MKVRATHIRPRIKTAEQAAAWLRAWDSADFLPSPRSLPQKPWRSSTDRQIVAVAEALMKIRDQYDAGCFDV